MLKYILYLGIVGSVYTFQMNTSITKFKKEEFCQNTEDRSIELSLAQDKSIHSKIEEFIDDVLGEFKKSHTFSLTNKSNPDHLRIFSKNGLNQISGYSDKRYPKKFQPNQYEHFALFVLEYKTENHAKQAYNTLKTECEFDYNTLDQIKDEKDKEFKRFLHGHIKSGGMVIQIENIVLSLVETCRNTPIGGRWIDYENKFIKTLVKDKSRVKVLNANCGGMYYKEESRVLK